MQISASTMKKERREVAHVLGQHHERDGDELGDDDRGGGGDRVADPGVAPDGAVEAERDEREVARGEHDGRVSPAMNRWLVLPGQPNSIAYAATNEPLMRTKSTPTSTSRRQCIAKTWVSETGSSSCGPAVGVGEEARELDQEREGDDDADDGVAPVVEDVVGEARAADGERDQRQERDRTALGEAVADEPVGGVVAAALVDRAPVEHPSDRDERRVEDRDGQDEHRQDQRRDGRAGHAPARDEPERGEREPERLAARVAHEDERAAAGAEVEGRKPQQAAAPAIANASEALSGWTSRRRRRRRRTRSPRESPRGRPCCRAG